MRPATPAMMVIALAVPVQALACSVVSTYRVPTTLELVARAETIVLGTVTDGVEAENVFDSRVIVRPTMLLKGADLPSDVQLNGYLAKDGELVTKSDLGELFAPNPDALRGGCMRYVFEKDMTLLLFLERREGVLRFASYPFARVAEDVPSPDARWVKAVKFYIAIAALPRKERRAALVEKRDKLRLETGDADALAIAEDIDRQLKSSRIAPFD